MNVKEIAIYSIQSNVDADTYKKANKRLDAFLEMQPGYRGRELLYDAGNDVWIDLVFWDDMPSAKGAGERALKSPDCADIFALIVNESVRMLHAERVSLA